MRALLFILFMSVLCQLNAQQGNTPDTENEVLQEMEINISAEDNRDLEEVEIDIESVEEGDHRRIEIHKKGPDGEIIEFEWEGEGEIPEHIKKHIDPSFDHPLPKAFLGVIAKDIEGQDQIVIQEIIENSAAEEMGLLVGDKIISIDGDNISSVKDLIHVLADYNVGNDVEIAVDRTGTIQRFQGTLQERPEEYGEINKVIEIKTDISLPDQVEWKTMDDIDLIGLHDEGDHIKTEVIKDGSKRIIIIKKRSKNNSGENNENGDKFGDEPSSAANSNLHLEGFSAFPNPTGNHVRVSFQAEPKPLSVRILDINGKAFYEEQLNHFDGNYSRLINFRNAIPGTYLLQISQVDKVFTQQLIYQ